MSKDVQGTWYPVFYEADAQFLGSGSAPSGAAGSKAQCVVDVNNRPQQLTGIRFGVTYDLPPLETFDPTRDLAAYLQRWAECADAVLMSTDLAQSNIVVGSALAPLVVGGARASGGRHWHPLPVPMLWRGGNNIRFNFELVLPFPDFIDSEQNLTPVTPHVYVVTEGCQLITDLVPPAGPPSTGWAS